ncbi:transcriptional regulator [Catellatospora sp. TT07R-123]|uniref:helix-turn-helix domain-containing protein n=1 Tax=Catellatospora sp. TT07R-123 TaxID=2733863 RepID=UPI001B226027|nr:helix-turn-helix transcriptional regulator [Catellatospora sp. TT07R-123]GHJ42962.1 transcriptional regulator [Catellatospora sp. TT07R-123]
MPTDDAYAETGRRIRSLRIAQLRKQADLIVPGLLSASYLSLIESGQRQPSPAVLAHLARMLGTTPEFLATGTSPPVPPEQADAERRVAFGELALHHGDHAEALAEFTALAGTAVAERAALGRARALEFLDQPAVALAEFERLRAAAEPGGLAWAERTVDVMRCAQLLGDVGYAVQLGEAAMELLTSLGADWTDTSIRLGVTLAGAHRTQRNLHRAATLLERLAAAADQLGSPLARGSTYWNAAVVAHTRGRSEHARELAERALALLGETENVRNVAQLRQALAYLLVHDEPAQPERAVELLRRARTSLLELGSGVDVANGDAMLALALLKSGDPVGALEPAWAAYRAVPDPTDVVGFSVLLTLAEVELATGDRESADVHLARAERSLAEQPDPPWAAEMWARAGALLEELGLTDRALRAYRRGLTAGGHRVDLTRQTPDLLSRHGHVD